MHTYVKSDAIAYKLRDVCLSTFLWQVDGKTLNIYIRSNQYLCVFRICLTIFSVFPSQAREKVKSEVVAYKLRDVCLFTFLWQVDGKTLNIYIHSGQHLCFSAFCLSIFSVFQPVFTFNLFLAMMPLLGSCLLESCISHVKIRSTRRSEFVVVRLRLAYLRKNAYKASLLPSFATNPHIYI